MKKLITSTLGTISTLLSLRFLISQAAHERVKNLFRKNIKTLTCTLIYIFYYNISVFAQGMCSMTPPLFNDPDPCIPGVSITLGLQGECGNCNRIAVRFSGRDCNCLVGYSIEVNVTDLTTGLINNAAMFGFGTPNAIDLCGNEVVFSLPPGNWKVYAFVRSAPQINDELIVDFDPNLPSIGTGVGSTSNVSCRYCSDGLIAAFRNKGDYCHFWTAVLFKGDLLFRATFLSSNQTYVSFGDLPSGNYVVKFWYTVNGNDVTHSSHPVTIEKPRSANAKIKYQGRRRQNNLAFGIEGDNNSNVNDTAIVFLRNVNPPYDIVDTSKSSLDTDGNGEFNFHNADVGTPYYIVATHRNSLETWSSSGQVFGTDSLMNFDFSTSASQAYGNNMVLVDGEWTFYSGDVNQDGVIDLIDLTLVYDDASTFVTGYVVTDLTGDDIVDLDDMLIVYENANKFVTVRRP